MKRNFLLLILLLIAASHVAVAQQDPRHPEIEPRESGYLRVSDIHELYWELVGNPEGMQVIVLHGGPGGSAGPDMRRYFDPQKYNVLLFDQRGAGRSRPVAEWKQNTTALLIEDINTLREHVGFGGPAILLGGSWGSTLAIAYAEEFPELVSGMVLRGIFLGSKAEIDHFYHGGAERVYPLNFARLQSILPEPETLNYPEQLFGMITSGDDEQRQLAIDTWAYYEIRMVSLGMTAELADQIVEQYDMTAFSTLENHYMMNGCFLEDEQLLENSDRIAHIPTHIVNGRFDLICPPITAIRLAEKLDTVQLDIPIAAHSGREPAIINSLMNGLDWVTEKIKIGKTIQDKP